MRKILSALLLGLLATCNGNPAYACTPHEENAGLCGKYFSAEETIPDNAGTWSPVAPSHRMKLTGGTSTINPGIPAQGSPLSSAPIRGNFQAAYNDINKLYTTFSGFGSMALQNANQVAIIGGAIDGTVIGSNVPSTAVFTGINLQTCEDFDVMFTDGSGNITCDGLLTYQTGEFLQLNSPSDISSWNLQVADAFTIEQFSADQGSGAQFYMTSSGGNNSDEGGAYIVLEDSNGSTDGSTTSLQFFTDGGEPSSSAYLNSGDVLGEFTWGSGKNDSLAAMLQITANGTQNGSSAPTKACLYTAAASTTTNSTNPALCLDSAYHANLSSTSTPAVSSCGGGTPAVSGNDQKGVITTGTSSPTACTLTFAKSFPAAAVCTANASAGFITVTAISASAVTFTISAGLTSGKIYYLCF